METRVEEQDYQIELGETAPFIPNLDDRNASYEDPELHANSSPLV